VKSVPAPDLARVLSGPRREFDPPLAHCPLCGAAQIAAFLEDGRGISLWRCGRCRVGFMNPRYSDGALAEYYAGYATEAAMESQALERRRLRKRASVARLSSAASRGRFLSVGAWDGLEVRLAADHGFEAEGFDVDPEATGRVAAELGRPIHCGDVLDDGWLPRDLVPAGRPAPGYGYAALMLDQVLEHPKQPGRYLARAASLLAPGGVLYLGVPNLGSLSNRLKSLRDRAGLSSQRRRGKHFDSWHHLTYFCPASLAYGIREVAGLELLTLAGEPDPEDGRLVARAKSLVPALESTIYALARKRA
jgi:SAM-dependent methyltransferase